MNVAHEDSLDRIFHALADRTRRKLLLKIAEKECRVTDLAKPFEMSLNGISKHLKVLEEAGLLRRSVDGRVHHCRADMVPLKKASDVIAHYKAFWEKQLDALESFLTQASEDETPKKEKKK